MIDLNTIKDDSFLKDKSVKELNELAKQIRLFLLENVSKTGGHLSSNLGDVELIIALHKVFDLNKDKLLFDVGHQAYTHKILTGRANQFDSLRTLNGLSGFLSSNESKYDVFESGHSSTSISTAMGMALARDNNKENYEVISLIGDASIVNGVSFEALNNISSNHNKVIIILNDNDMSVSKSVGAFAKSLSKVRSSKAYGNMKNSFLKTFKNSPKFVDFVTRFSHRMALIFRSDNMFDNFNISYLGPVDGHNIKMLIKALNKAKNYPGPILVHVKTKKGYGYKYAEEDKVGKYHGVSPFDINKGIEDSESITFTSLIANKMYETLFKDKNSYLISSAMVYATNFNKCFDTFKDRCIDVGIAEEHAVSLANGLALSNKNPYVSLYSTFMQRSYDQIVHDVCRINSNVTFLVDRAGIVGEDGKTHQGILDVSFVYPLQNSVICSLSEGKYINSLFNTLDKIKAPKFIRYQKLNTTNETYDKPIEFGKFIFEHYNEQYKTSLIVVGASCKVIKDYVIKNNLKYNVINPIFLKPLDIDSLNKITNTNVIVIDNTSIYDGFTSSICKYYNKINKNITYFTLPDEYITHGKYNDILKMLELDEISIINKIINKYGKD